MKEYECVEVKHHKDVGKVIAEWQKKGWRLHTYQVTIILASSLFNHSLACAIAVPQEKIEYKLGKSYFEFPFAP